MTNLNSLRKARWKAWNYMRNAGGRDPRRERMRKKYRRAMLHYIDLDWKYFKATATADSIEFMVSLANNGLTIKPQRTT